MTLTTCHRSHLWIAAICVALSLWCLSGVAWAQTQEAPRWAVVLGASGPLADGASTYWAMGSPNVKENNPFFHHLFGSNVQPGEILGVKIAQAALTGAAVHYIGQQDRKSAIGFAVVSAAAHFLVSAINVRNGRQGRRWSSSH